MKGIVTERELPPWTRRATFSEGQFSVFWRQGAVALMNVAGSMPGLPIDYEMEDSLHWIPPAVLIACGVEAMRRRGGRA